MNWTELFGKTDLKFSPIYRKSEKIFLFKISSHREYLRERVCHMKQVIYNETVSSVLAINQNVATASLPATAWKIT